MMLIVIYIDKLWKSCRIGGRYKDKLAYRKKTAFSDWNSILQSFTDPTCQLSSFYLQDGKKGVEPCSFFSKLIYRFKN